MCGSGAVCALVRLGRSIPVADGSTGTLTDTFPLVPAARMSNVSKKTATLQKSDASSLDLECAQPSFGVMEPAHDATGAGPYHP